MIPQSNSSQNELKKNYVAFSLWHVKCYKIDASISGSHPPQPTCFTPAVPSIIKVNNTQITQHQLDLIYKIHCSRIFRQKPYSKTHHHPSSVQYLVLPRPPKDLRIRRCLFHLQGLEVLLHSLCLLALVLDRHDAFAGCRTTYRLWWRRRCTFLRR